MENRTYLASLGGLLQRLRVVGRLLVADVRAPCSTAHAQAIRSKLSVQRLFTTSNGLRENSSDPYPASRALSPGV